MHKNTIILLTLLLITMFMSCSSESDNAVTDQLIDQDIQAKSQRQLLGIWRLDIDMETNSTKVEFDRDLAAHFDVTELIPPPSVTNESYDGNTNIYQADFTIENTLGYDCLDARMIVYTDDSGHELLNPDNWTPLYDIPGGAFINPFKAYAKTEPSRRFANAASHTETLNIFLPGGFQHQNVVLAIDASIPSNCEEPYWISNFTQENLPSGSGSNALITVDVFDWQSDIDSVKLHCPAITGNLTDDFTFDSGNTWSLNLINATGAAVGDYPVLISATSTGSGNLELYGFPTIEVSYFEWAKTWGGSADDLGSSVALDQVGNVFITGYFANSLEFNPDGGGLQSSNGGQDIFLSKFDPSGNWQWSKTWGGIEDDIGYMVVLDQLGNVYVLGYFWNIVDFNPDGGGTQSSNGGEDIFLSKFDSSGNWLWSKTWGGSGHDGSIALVLDQLGNLYITGHFEGTVDFNPDGGGTQSCGGYIGAFLSKFNTSGDWQWTKTWSGTGISRAYGYSVCDDQTNGVYVTGIFGDMIDFNPDGGEFKSSNGGYDAYLSKFDTLGNWQWVKTWGGNGYDVGRSLSSDQFSNIYLAGSFMGNVDFNPAGGGNQSAKSDFKWDPFLSKFNASGNWQWTKAWGGIEEDYGYLVCVDQAENIYVTGYFQDNVQFNPDGGDIQSSNGSNDVYLSKFDSSGNWLSTITWGDIGSDRGMSVISTLPNTVYVTGLFSTTVDFNPDGTDPQTSNGLADVFLWKCAY